MKNVSVEIVTTVVIVISQVVRNPLVLVRQTNTSLVIAKSVIAEMISHQLLQIGIENEYKIKVYPTPGSKVLSIENINFSLIHDFKIVDIFGREVKNFTVSSEKNTKMLVDTSKLSDGLYFIFFNTFI